MNNREILNCTKNATAWAVTLGTLLCFPFHNAEAQQASPSDAEAAADSTAPSQPAASSVSESKADTESNKETKAPGTVKDEKDDQSEAVDSEKVDSKEGANSGDPSQSESQAPADFHAETPPYLRNRLRFDVGASLGVGGGPSDFASDHLGFYVGSSYALQRLEALGLPLVWIVSGTYASQTGVDKRKSLDVVIQRFLVGGGMEVAPQLSNFRYGLRAQIGLSRAAAADLSPAGAMATSHGVAAAITASARYQLIPSTWVSGGIELVPISGEYSWYGLNMGLTLAF